MSSAEAASGPSHKRRKTQLACNPCRARKTGCDGLRPTCSSCALRGWQNRCTYQEKAVPTQAQAVTLVDVDRRLRELEDTLYSVDPVSKPEHVSSQTSRSGNLGRPSGQTSRPNTAVDFSFHRQLPTESSQEPISIPSFTEISTSQCSVSYSPDVTAIVLPDRSLADCLLQHYWAFVHPINPILHRPSFDSSYSKIWQPTTKAPSTLAFEDVTFHATLNIVFALGSKRINDLPGTGGEQLADMFYKRSLSLIAAELLDCSSLALVQLLLLRTIHLFYTPYANRCWNTVGIAVRMAQGLGLDNASMEFTPSNQLMREMRRRVWWNCEAWDRVTAYTFGRPRILSSQCRVPMPAPIDDEYLSKTREEGRQPDNLPSHLSFFIKTLDLSMIFEKAEYSKYCDPGRRGWPHFGKDLGVILDINSELEGFVEHLPAHLQAEDSIAFRVQGLNDPFQRQARALKLRALYYRLSLLRPVLLAEAHEQAIVKPGVASNSGLQERLRDDICALCVSTAHTVLEVVHRELAPVHRISTWHALYYAFSAASVLVAATLCLNLGVRLNMEPGKTSWDRAIQTFEFHKSHNVCAERGIEILESFRRSVEARLAGRSGKLDLASAGTSDLETSIPQNGTSIIDIDDSYQAASEERNIDFEEFLASDALNQSWLTSQDFGIDDWILHGM